MNEKFMYIALKNAKKAYKKAEVPVGCVIVKNSKIIASSFNKIEKCNNQTKHAEMIAISYASKKLKNWRLIDCDMYVTLEPCDMCLAAISLSRIRNVYFILKRDNNIKMCDNLIYMSNLESEYKNILQSFFKEKRIKK